MFHGLRIGRVPSGQNTVAEEDQPGGPDSRHQAPCQSARHCHPELGACTVLDGRTGCELEHRKSTNATYEYSVVGALLSEVDK